MFATDGESRAGRGAAAVGGAGLIGVLSGAGAWVTVRRQLAGERIAVPPTAALLAGRAVKGPLSAYAEAEFIRQAALRATGGRPYGALAEDDPAAPVAREASLLRASLFTSILAFGVAAAGIAIGSVLMILARILARTG